MPPPPDSKTSFAAMNHLCARQLLNAGGADALSLSPAGRHCVLGRARLRCAGGAGFAGLAVTVTALVASECASIKTCSVPGGVKKA